MPLQRPQVWALPAPAACPWPLGPGPWVAVPCAALVPGELNALIEVKTLKRKPNPLLLASCLAASWLSADYRASQMRACRNTTETQLWAPCLPGICRRRRRHARPPFTASTHRAPLAGAGELALSAPVPSGLLKLTTACAERQAGRQRAAAARAERDCNACAGTRPFRSLPVSSADSEGGAVCCFRRPVRPRWYAP